MKFELIFLLYVTVTCQAARRLDVDEYCPLCDYVYTDDGYYEYTLLDTYNRSLDLDIPVTTYYIRMTSQKWLNESYSSPAVWTHTMYIHVPYDVRYADDTMMVITGGVQLVRDYLYDSDTNYTAQYTASAGMVTGVLFHIQNQPIVYTDDPDQEGRYEDDAIAWTWRYYADKWVEEGPDTNPEVVLRMPMCKGTIKAMDTMQSFVRDDLGVATINRFMLSGQSKRGWITWVSGAIDDRVVAIVPTILTCMNLTELFHHYYRSYGGWPYYYWPFWNKGLTGRLDSPEMQALWDIIDPYSYREWMDFPKLVVAASSDEFFLVSDTHYWWDNLPGEKYMWWIENSGHFIGGSPSYNDYWKVMETFHKNIINNVSRPDISWMRESPSERDGVGSITVFTDQEPTYITAFSAMSVVPQRRDWRYTILCNATEPCFDKPSDIVWEETAVDQVSAVEYYVEYEVPDDGFLAFHIYMEFAAPDNEKYIFTTESNVIPQYFPFDDCLDVQCQGLLK